jgi:hypothetical protein
MKLLKEGTWIFLTTVSPTKSSVGDQKIFSRLSAKAQTCNPNYSGGGSGKKFMQNTPPTHPILTITKLGMVGQAGHPSYVGNINGRIMVQA